MLILTRRIGETIRVGDEICVTVLALKGGQVRIGITAPASVEVHREEIFRRIALERAAPQSDAPQLPVAQPAAGSPTVRIVSRKLGRKLLCINE